MILEISANAVPDELRKIGVHPASIPIFKKRTVIEPIKICQVRMPAANILKQEALSSGADCAVHSDCVTGKVDFSDVLLLGNRRQYEDLLRKLAPMTFFGLPELCEKLQAFLISKAPKIVLADGRVLGFEKTTIMGIVNLTSDSFYQASCTEGIVNTLKTVETMLADGAEIIDVGSESTRPGAVPLNSDEECEYLLPAVREIKKSFPNAVLSIDTYKAETAKKAIECGADMINDISGASDSEMGSVVSSYGVPIIIMHLNTQPQFMKPVMSPEEINKVWKFLEVRRKSLQDTGVKFEKIILDPGFGFGKSLELNLLLMRRLKELVSLGSPVLVAASRKGTIGKVLGGLPVEERLAGTLALSCQAVAMGAQIVRVHDVKENVQAIRMMEAVQSWQ